VISESKIRPSLTEFRDFSVNGRGGPAGDGESGWNRCLALSAADGNIDANDRRG
jgi:hypothetical protein